MGLLYTTVLSYASFHIRLFVFVCKILLFTLFYYFLFIGLAPLCLPNHMVPS